MSSSICAHIHQFYPHSKRVEPVLFWEFLSETTLPQNAQLVQSVSEHNDACHHNVMGLTKGQAKKIAYSINLNSCLICENGTARKVLQEDLPS